ncbi:hypothetical protein ACFVYG_22535 [Streptomyces sp. NPDC058256]|uniref:hypothetical protein n=1 Tax=Streptomyces sp. NPDC058256 TaxID=3346408 RepID=UPI0036EDA292
MSRRRDGRELAEQKGVLVRIAAPSAPACTAVLSTGSVSTLLASGTVPPDSPLVWPLVVLALGSMAYDLGVRALHR